MAAVLRAARKTGLRIAEAIALRWGDVDLGRRRVQVRRRFYRGAFAPPKSRYGIRDVPIGLGLGAELELRWLLVDDVEARVFPSSTGSVLDADNLRRRVLKPAARRVSSRGRITTLAVQSLVHDIRSQLPCERRWYIGRRTY